MKTLKSLGIWLLALAVAGLVCLLISNPHYTVTFTQQQVQQKLDAKLPFTPAPRLGVQLTLQPGTQVVFLPSGQVGFSGNFTVKPTLTRESHADGTFAATGTLVYQDQAFYLRDIQLQTLTGQAVLSPRAQALGNLVRRLPERLIADNPTLQTDLKTLFNPDDLRTILSQALVKRLAGTPVYRLDNARWWHWFAGQALDQLEVTDQKITATLNLNRLLLSTALIVVAVVLAAGVVFTLATMGGGGLLVLLSFGALS